MRLKIFRFLLFSMSLLSLGLLSQSVALDDEEKLDLLEEVEELIEEKNDSTGTAELLRMIQGPVYVGTSVEDSIYKVLQYLVEFYDGQDYAEPLDQLVGIYSFFANTHNPEVAKQWQVSLLKRYKLNGKARTAFIQDCFDFFVKSQMLDRFGIVWSYKGLDKIGFGEHSQKGPFVEVFSPFSLHCQQKDKTMDVQSTKGKFYLMKDLWEGQGGRVNWIKAGRNDVKSWFDSPYTLNLKKPYLKVEQAFIQNDRSYAGPRKGLLEDRLSSKTSLNADFYPRFTTYDQDVVLKEIEEYIDFQGGVVQEAGNIKGVSNIRDGYNVFINDKDGIRIGMRADEIRLEDKLLKLPQNSLRIETLRDKNFLLNSQVLMEYNVLYNTLTLESSRKSQTQVRYLDGLHNSSFNIDFMQYDFETNMFTLYNHDLGINDQKVSYIESSNYFDKEFFVKLFYRQDLHPLSMIKNYQKKYPYDEIIYVTDFSNYIRKDSAEVKLLIYTLALEGIVNYNSKEQYFRPLDKLDDYLDYYANKKDYDQIIMSAKNHSNGNYGSINVVNDQFKVFAPEYMQISRNKKVFLRPDTTMTYLPGGDFFTGGYLNGGYVGLTGKSYSFEYNKYLFRVKGAESLELRVRSADRNEDYKEVRSLIEDLDAILVVDYPKNKSGNFQTPNFPDLRVQSTSYIYWDRSMHEYEREDFNFQVLPFTLDSLTYHIRRSQEFFGTFHSSIFRDFNYRVHIQPDLALGFKINTGDSINKIYDERGYFFGGLNLNFDGLFGKGKLMYEHMRLYASNYLFLLDQMAGKIDSSQVPEQKDLNLPELDLKNSLMDWYVEEDSVRFKSKRTPIYIGLDTVPYRLAGELNFVDERYYGSGSFNKGPLNVRSKNMRFSIDSLLSTEASFSIFDNDIKEYSLKTNKAKLELIHSTNEAHLRRKDEDYSLRFPANEMQAKAASVHIDIANKRYRTRSNGFRMKPTRFDMSGISFFAKKIDYRNKDKVLVLKGVDSLVAFDEEIELDKSTIEVMMGGDFDEATMKKIFTEAYLQKDSLARLGAGGGNNPAALDKKRDQAYTVQEPRFAFHQKLNLATVVEDPYNSLLPEDYEKTEVEELIRVPKHLYTPLSVLPDYTGIGPVFSYTESALYPTYTGYLAAIMDNKLVDASEMIAHHADSSLVAQTVELYTDTAQFGQKISFSTQSRRLHGKTYLDLIPKRGLVQQKNYGSYTLSEETPFRPRLASSFNFKFEEDVWEEIAQFIAVMSQAAARDKDGDLMVVPDASLMTQPELVSGTVLKQLQTLGLSPGDLNPQFRRIFSLEVLHGILATHELEAATELLQNYAQEPQEMETGLDEDEYNEFFFDDLQLEFNEMSKSYRSVGKLGLFSVGNMRINKKVQGVVEMTDRPKFASFTIYLVADTNWILFDYNIQKLSIRSSNERLHSLIEELDKDDKFEESEDKSMIFSYDVMDSIQGITRVELLNELLGIVKEEPAQPQVNKANKKKKTKKRRKKKSKKKSQNEKQNKEALTGSEEE